MKNVHKRSVAFVVSMTAAVNSIPLTGVSAEGSGTESVWKFTTFGVSTSTEANRLMEGTTAAEGTINGKVSLGSATFNEDGSIGKKGGKFVADSSADGASYYYTTIDPTTTNFVLQADVTVDQMNPKADGQEGFALMVRDAIGAEGNTGGNMANLVSVTGTKLPMTVDDVQVEQKDTIGIRAYTGIYSPNPTTAEDPVQNKIKTTREGWYSDESGNPRLIAAGETYRVRLEKTSSAYITSQYAINPDGTSGDLLGEYIYYISAKDPDAASITSYTDLDDPLTYQENNTAYVALVTARGMNATFDNIIYETSEWKAEDWAPRPTVYIDPVYVIADSNNPESVQSTTAADNEYELFFKANADGTANIYRDDTLIGENVSIKANELFSQKYPMTADSATFKVSFTPDPAYIPGEFEKLSNYDPKDLTVTVTQRTLGAEDTIYVSASGTSANNGTSPEDAVDIQTALNYAKPGQTILLASETYTFNSNLYITRGRNGTEEKPITVKTADGKFAAFDFANAAAGFKVWGNYWNISNINIKNSTNKGLQLCGNHNLIERMNFFNNGNSGLQISGLSAEDPSLWPSYNTIKNCSSFNNADGAVEDADGFACKLTSGAGNVFDGCIAAYNADDGWDLFAKVATGPIGAVEIKNCVTYKNGYLMVKEGSSKNAFTLAEISCDDNGTLTFTEGAEMEAGNGNGFKMGGSDLPGGHKLVNSIAYDNKAKGIDSNSCPDISAKNCVSYNNGGANVAFYTNNSKATTAFKANGVISYRKGDKFTDIDENLKLQNQDESDVKGVSNYYWSKETKTSSNTEGDIVTDEWFDSLDTSVAPTRNADGTIDMHGLLQPKSEEPEPPVPPTDDSVIQISADKTLASAINDINDAIKHGTQKDSYTLRITADSPAETKALTLPDVPITITAAEKTAFSVPSITAKNDLTINNVDLKGNKDSSTPITSKKLLRATNSTFGAVKASGQTDFINCVINGAVKISNKEGTTSLYDVTVTGKLTSANALIIQNGTYESINVSAKEVSSDISGAVSIKKDLSVKGNLNVSALDGNSPAVGGKLTVKGILNVNGFTVWNGKQS